MSGSRASKGVLMLMGILWAIVVILVILWLIGWLALHAGGLIFILLAVAVIVALFSLFFGRGSA